VDEPENSVASDSSLVMQVKLAPNRVASVCAACASSSGPCRSTAVDEIARQKALLRSPRDVGGIGCRSAHQLTSTPSFAIAPKR